MSILERSEVRGQRSGTKEHPSAPSLTSDLRPLTSNRSSFATYFTKHGWIHALLLLFVWLFLFPFLWMLSTSFKTDDELTDTSVLPVIPTFRAASPYVRDIAPPQRPSDAPVDRWEKVLPTLTQLARDAVTAYQKPQPSLAKFDADAHRSAATATVLSSAVAKLNKNLWTGPEADLLAEYKSLLTGEAVTAALNTSLARLELLTFQLRTLDVHMHNLTTGKDFATNWKIESGPAQLFPLVDSTLLSYNFASPDSAPIVLHCDFTLPPGVATQDIHKLIVSFQADDSWHRVDATLDTEGRHWTSQRTTYISQYRTASLTFQPPTFDDESLRAKHWVPLRESAIPDPKSPIENPESKLENGTGLPSTLRLTISPSSTLRAIYGKTIRNYQRAFNSVPVWTYIWNSTLLVALTTLGALFSASFVAYAFARLHWPGRSVAFLILLCTMMLPAQVTMIPGFLIWRSLHWYNTLNPLWVPSFFGGAFFVFLMTQHMKTIPRELEEAAKLDGLSHIQSWWYIILPNVKPTLAAIAILSFMGAWNEFMGPLIYLRDQAKFPLSLGLYGMKVDQTGGIDWTMMMAGNMLMTIPVIIVFFLFQRYFVQGMTMTGMKG